MMKTTTSIGTGPAMKSNTSWKPRVMIISASTMQAVIISHFCQFFMFLVVISIFIISNTIKLTVHARRKEISIMKYVGATNNFIRGPFVVEGIIIGVVSAMLSIGFIALIYDFIAAKIMASPLMGTMGISLMTFSEIFNLILVVYLVLGIGIGVLGSILSMKKYLEV